MAHAKADINELRRLFVFEKQSLTQAANLLNIDYSTASRWRKRALKKGDDWDKLRAAATFAGGELEDIAKSLLTDLVVQYKSTIDSLQKAEDISAQDKVKLLASLSDSYNKTIGASKKILPQTSELATALKTLEIIGKHIADNKPQLLQAFSEILTEVGELISVEFSDL